MFDRTWRRRYKQKPHLSRNTRARNGAPFFLPYQILQRLALTIGWPALQ